MSNQLKQNPLSQRVLAALILIQILFGMNYIFSKIVLDNLPASVWASLRAIATALILVFISLFRGNLDIARGFFYYRQLIIYSMLGIVFSQGLFLIGLQYTTATNSALINTLIPVFTVLLVVMRGQESISKKRLLGFIFAFIGVLFIHKYQEMSFSSITFLGDLCILVNTLSYSLFLSYSHRFFEKVDFVWSTTWLFIYGAVGLTLVAIPSYSTMEWVGFSTEIWACIALSIGLGTVLPYLLISFTLGRTHSSVVALFIYIQPVLAALLSFLFFQETVPTRTILAGAFIFMGVILATSKGSEVADPTKVISLDFEKNHGPGTKKTHHK